MKTGNETSLRKATALVLLEMYFIVGQEKFETVSELLDEQGRRVINAYVSKRVELTSKPSQ